MTTAQKYYIFYENIYFGDKEQTFLSTKRRSDNKFKT